jgi:hypothetical protein
MSSLVNTNHSLLFKSSPSKQKQRLSKLMAINSINHRPSNSSSKTHKSFTDDLENKHCFKSPSSHNITLQSHHLNRYTSNSKKRNTQQRKTLNEKTNQNDTTLLNGSSNTIVQKTISSNRNNLEETSNKKSNNKEGHNCSSINNSFLNIVQNGNESKNNLNENSSKKISNQNKNNEIRDDHIKHVLVPKWRVNVIKASYKLEGTEVIIFI